MSYSDYSKSFWLSAQGTYITSSEYIQSINKKIRIKNFISTSTCV